MNVGVRKLADNLQTVKTVLGMKIQSEQKLVGIFVSGLVKHSFERKIVNIFLPISYNICFGCLKEPSH